MTKSSLPGVDLFFRKLLSGKWAHLLGLLCGRRAPCLGMKIQKNTSINTVGGAGSFANNIKMFCSCCLREKQYSSQKRARIIVYYLKNPQCLPGSPLPILSMCFAKHMLKWQGALLPQNNSHLWFFSLLVSSLCSYWILFILVFIIKAIIAKCKKVVR